MPALAESQSAEPFARWANWTEAHAVYDVLTSGFAADPANRWMYSDDEQYLRYFPAFAKAFGGQAFIHGTAVLSENKAGAALWLPPGSTPDEEALAVLIEETVTEGKKADLGAVFEELGRYHPEGPHWHLALIGVRAWRQGEGHGSAMIKLGLAECDRAGVPAYLEATSAKSIPLYQRHGFELLGALRFGTCPPLFPMLRVAREPRKDHL